MSKEKDNVLKITVHELETIYSKINRKLKNNPEESEPEQDENAELGEAADTEESADKAEQTDETDVTDETDETEEEITDEKPKKRKKLSLNKKLKITLWGLALLAFGLFWAFNLGNISFVRSVCYFIMIFSISKGIGEPSIINPYFLFVPVPLALLVYNEAVGNKYLLHLSTYTYIFAIMNMMVYLAALMFTRGHSERQDVGLDTKKRLMGHGWIMFILAVIGNIFLPLSAVLPFFQYPALACQFKAKRYKTMIFMLLVLFFINMNFVNKTMLLGVSILMVLCYTKYVIKKRMSIGLAIMLAVVAVVMILMFNIKAYMMTGHTFMEYVRGGFKEYQGIGNYYLQHKEVQWNGPEWLLTPYLYLTTPWANLQYLMYTQRNYTLGLWTLKPIIGWLQLDGFFKKAYYMHSFSRFNTFTYLGIFFKDFGYVGSCLGSAFLGFFVKRIYNKFCVSDSPFDIAAYAVVAQAAAEMFFSNHFFGESYPFTIVIIIAVYRWFMRAYYRTKKK